MQDRKKLWQQAGSIIGTAAAGTTEQKKQQARKAGAAVGEAIAKSVSPSPISSAASPTAQPAAPAQEQKPTGKSLLSKLRNKMPGRRIGKVL